MNDRQLRLDVIVVLVMLLVIGLSYAIVSSRTYQEIQFLRDCSDTQSTEYCEELWRLGNER